MKILMSVMYLLPHVKMGQLAETPMAHILVTAQLDMKVVTVLSTLMTVLGNPASMVALVLMTLESTHVSVLMALGEQIVNMTSMSAIQALARMEQPAMIMSIPTHVLVL